MNKKMTTHRGQLARVPFGKLATAANCTKHLLRVKGQGQDTRHKTQDSRLKTRDWMNPQGILVEGPGWFRIRRS